MLYVAHEYVGTHAGCQRALNQPVFVKEDISVFRSTKDVEVRFCSNSYYFLIVQADVMAEEVREIFIDMVETVKFLDPWTRHVVRGNVRNLFLHKAPN